MNFLTDSDYFILFHIISYYFRLLFQIVMEYTCSVGPEAATCSHLCECCLLGGPERHAQTGEFRHWKDREVMK